jgi:hypothetical protein
LSVSFRRIGFAVVISLMVLGCAANQPETAEQARMWQRQLERQQDAARDAGRIGWIGNAGPPSQ